MSYWYLIPNHILLLSAFIFIGKQNKKIKYLFKKELLKQYLGCIRQSVNVDSINEGIFILSVFL